MNRQKAHAALDALLDAIGEQAEEAPAAPRERRKRVLRHPEPPAGWPDCEVDISACELVRSATDEQHEAHVKLWADRVDQRDRRTRHVERLYPEAWAKAGAK